MRKTILTALTSMLLVAGVAVAIAADRFATMSLRGRYSGNLTLAEHIPMDENNTLTIDARQLLALTFDGRSGVTGVTSVTAAIPSNPPTIFTCVFTVEGTYEVAESGLGTATLNITPTTACAGPGTLTLTLLVGGRNRNRIDATIDGATGLGSDAGPIALFGSGTLTEQ